MKKRYPIKLFCQQCKKEYLLYYRIPKKDELNRKFCSNECRLKSGVFCHKNSHSEATRDFLSRIQLGKHSSPSTEFRKGSIPINKGMKRPQVSKEKHWNWQGGISEIPYPLGWTNTYREQIRKRDAYKCQVCGCPEVECNRLLSVHHIDYDKHNLDIHNLVSLCVRCHMKTNYNRDYWINYFKTKETKYAYEAN